MNPDEIVLPLVWGVLAQDSKTGAWRLRSVHMTEDEANAACDRETLRVLALESHIPGTHESAVTAWMAAMVRAADTERETIALVVAKVERDLARVQAFIDCRPDPETTRYSVGQRDAYAVLLEELRGAWKEDGDG